MAVLGNQTQTSTTAFGVNAVIGSKFTLASNASLASMSVWNATAGHSFVLAVYADSAGNPGALRGQTNTGTTAGGSAFQTLSFASPLALSAGTYWLVVLYGGAGSVSTGVTTGSADYVLSTYPTLPDPFGSPTTTGALLAIYATYSTAPANTVAPAVTGTTTVGQTLSTTNGTWTDDGSPAFTYQWQRDTAGNLSFSNISSATSSTYTLVDADDGNKIRCQVKDTDSTGNTTANSNAVGLIVESAVPANTVAPTVSGIASQGATLTSTTGTWSHTGNSTTYAYQWTRNGSNISAATSSTYATQAADLGTNVGCKVTPTNDVGAGTGQASSNTITVTAAAVPTNTVALTTWQNAGTPPSGWASTDASARHLTVPSTLGRVTGTAGIYALDYYSGSTFGPDTDIYIEMFGIDAGTDYIGLRARITSPGASHNGYLLRWQQSDNTLKLIRVDAAAETVLASTSLTLTTGYYLWLSCRGTTITGYTSTDGLVWTPKLSATDTTYQAAGYVGLDITSGTTSQMGALFGGTATNPNQWGLTKVQPLLSLGAGGAWDNPWMAEPTALIDGSSFVINYDGEKDASAANWAMGQATCPIASDPSVPANWTKYGSNPVVGHGTGGNITGPTICSSMTKVGATYYLYYALASEYPNTNLYVSTSTDRLTWGVPAVAVAHNAVAWVKGWINSTVWNEGGSVWKMICDCVSTSGTPIWTTTYLTSTDGLAWTPQGSGPLSTLQFDGTSSYANPGIVRDGAKIGGKYWLAYSLSPGSEDGSNGNLQSTTYLASSPDLVTWTPNQSPLISFDGSVYCKQQAVDPTVLESGGKTYFFYTGADNVAFAAYINVAVYNGTFEQLAGISTATFGGAGVMMFFDSLMRS